MPQRSARPAGRSARTPDVVTFALHQFPIGHLPVAQTQPCRQVELPGHDAGRCGELAAHPRADLVDDAAALCRAQAADSYGAERLGPGTDLPAELLVDYQTTGGVEPLVWEQRYRDRTTERARYVWSVDDSAAAGVGHRELDANSTQRDGAQRDDAQPNGVTRRDPGYETQSGQDARQSADGAVTDADGAVTDAGATDAGCVLEPGTLVDLLGSTMRRVVFTAGTPFAQRAQPPEYRRLPYRTFQVTKPTPVWCHCAAPWFGQPGGGTSYVLPNPVVELLALGQLTEVRDDVPTRSGTSVDAATTKLEMP